MPLFGAMPKAARPEIAGMTYCRDFVSAGDAAALCRHIDAQPWRQDLKRRVQHYGYRYDYIARTVGRDAYLGPLPDWLHPLGRAVSAPQCLGAVPDQVIVNEYLPGQGIAAHVDCVPCFGPGLAILSLGSPCVMIFTQVSTAVRHAVVLEARSLTILSGAARYDWQHGIPARKSDTINGIKVARGRRLSLTFRTVILAGASPVDVCPPTHAPAA
jgi:alkylated DNA repair dioxygenase AlkB